MVSRLVPSRESLVLLIICALTLGLAVSLSAEQKSGSETKNEPSQERAFLVGVDSGGAVVAAGCLFPTVCPSDCMCYDGDFPFCAYGSGGCRIDLCQVLGCPPVV